MSGATLIALSRDRYWLREGPAGARCRPVRGRAGVCSRQERRGGRQAEPGFLRGRAAQPGRGAARLGGHGGGRPLVRRPGRAAGWAAGLAGPHREVPGRDSGESGITPDRILDSVAAWVGGLIFRPHCSAEHFFTWSSVAPSASPAACGHSCFRFDSRLRPRRIPATAVDPALIIRGVQAPAAGHLRSRRAELVRPARPTACISRPARGHPPGAAVRSGNPTTRPGGGVGA